MKSNSLPIFLLFAVVLMHFANASYISTGMCNYTISGTNESYVTNGSCPLQHLVFAQGAYNDRLLCNNSSVMISGIIFANETYNNTVSNCTFSNAIVRSMRNAFNNIISPSGSYSFNFSDNYSNIALGYYFTFVPKSNNSDMFQSFTSVVPYEFASLNFQVFNNQQLTMNEIESEAKKANLTLPRFGVYTPSGQLKIISLALEVMELSKNRTRNFNPYWFICPDWGHDVLSYYKFNLNSNTNYTPIFLVPTLPEDSQFPDNTPIFWNFTVTNYSNASNVTAYMFSGYQFEPPNTVEVIRNFTGDELSYYRGRQKPGIYQFIAELRAVHDGKFEQSNSTTINYGVGIAFCTEHQMPIGIPGYYSMASKRLEPLGLANSFSTTNNTCGVALIIESSNVTIDCKGGAINSTLIDVRVINSKKFVLENCRLSGNVMNASNSEVEIKNSILTANRNSDIAFSGYNSSIIFVNTSMLGYGSYSKQTVSSLSTINQNSSSKENANQSNETLIKNPETDTLYSDSIYILVLFVVFAVVWIFYIITFSRRKQ